MRGLIKAAAALLLAPALARASFIDIDKTVPSAFITLQVPYKHQETKALTLRLDVEESEQVCGKANVKINGQSLSQSVTGTTATGHGPLTIEDGVKIDASWIFSCVESGNLPLEQTMSFTVKSVNWEVVKDASFSASFRQVAPVMISDVSGATYVYRLYVPNGEDADKEKENQTVSPEDELQAEIRELELLRIEADELEERIHAKELAILERFGGAPFDEPPPPPPPPSMPLGECESIHCVLRELTHRVKHTAGRFCSGMMGPDSFIGRHWNKGHHPHHHHEHGGFPLFGEHGNRTHGNHSRPWPPHRRPHHGERPPFCIPYPGGPEHPPPPPPPGHAPPPHHDGPPPPPPFWDHPPPPPSHGDWPPPPPPHHGDQPPPPPPHGERPPPPPPEHGDHPPPPPPPEHPHAEASKDHDGPPPPPPHGHEHGGPKHHRPPPPEDLIITLGMGAIFFGVLALIGITYVHKRMARFTRHGRHGRRRLSREERRARRHNRNSNIRDFFRRMLCHLDEDEEEKRAMLRRGSFDSDDETTMEEEIVQFRNAASVVEGMVAAEEGRSMSQSPMVQQTTTAPVMPTPAPPMVPVHDSVAYHGYMYGDEVLPAYEDDSTDSSVVSDGCRYTPGASDYTPSNGSNADDVLGDSKN